MWPPLGRRRLAKLARAAEAAKVDRVETAGVASFIPSARACLSSQKRLSFEELFVPHCPLFSVIHVSHMEVSFRARGTECILVIHVFHMQCTTAKMPKHGLIVVKDIFG